MTTEEMESLFENNDDYLEFKLVENRFSNRPDLHAFILLDKLVPGTSDIISDAQHDEFWLDTDVDELAKVITPEQVTELVRCGVRYSESSLCMYS